MISAEAHAEILRAVAMTTAGDARSAWGKAKASPTQANLRAAFRACVLAARAMRRASTVWPDVELAMIEESLLLDEIAAGLKARLVLMESWEPDPPSDPID